MISTIQFNGLTYGPLNAMGLSHLFMPCWQYDDIGNSDDDDDDDDNNSSKEYKQSSGNSDLGDC